MMRGGAEPAARAAEADRASSAEGDAPLVHGESPAAEDEEEDDTVVRICRVLEAGMYIEEEEEESC